MKTLLKYLSVLMVIVVTTNAQACFFGKVGDAVGKIFGGGGGGRTIPMGPDPKPGTSPTPAPSNDLKPGKNAPSSSVSESTPSAAPKKLTPYEEKYPNGKAKAVGFNDPTTHTKETKWKYFHENGKMESEGSYKHDVKDGIWTYWDSTGKIARKELWKDGAIVVTPAGDVKTKTP